jgi:hypothetical protein
LEGRWGLIGTEAAGAAAARTTLPILSASSAATALAADVSTGPALALRAKSTLSAGPTRATRAAWPSESTASAATTPSAAPAAASPKRIHPTCRRGALKVLYLLQARLNCFPLLIARLERFLDRVVHPLAHLGRIKLPARLAGLARRPAAGLTTRLLLLRQSRSRGRRKSDHQPE